MARRASGQASAAAANALLSKGSAVRVLLITGKETFLREGYARAFIETLERSEGGKDAVETVRFDGATAAIADVLDECRSFGLMSGYKAVIVDNADALIKDQNRAILERYAESPSDTATLILRSEGWRPGNFDKAVAKVGGRIQCDAVDDATAMGQATRRARERRGVTLEKDAAALLVERVGTDLSRLMSEVDKLSDAAGKDGTIDRPLVVELVGVSREEQVWSVQGALLTGDAGYAIETVRDLIHVSRVPTILVRFAFVDLARKLAAVSSAVASGARAQDAAKSQKLWGPALSSVVRLATPERAPALRALFRATVEADQRGKTGRGDEMRALEALSVQFAATLSGSTR